MDRTQTSRTAEVRITLTKNFRSHLALSNEHYSAGGAAKWQRNAGFCDPTDGIEANERTPRKCKVSERTSALCMNHERNRPLNNLLSQI